VPKEQASSLMPFYCCCVLLVTAWQLGLFGDNGHRPCHVFYGCYKSSLGLSDLAATPSRHWCWFLGGALGIVVLFCFGTRASQYIMPAQGLFGIYNPACLYIPRRNKKGTHHICLVVRLKCCLRVIGGETHSTGGVLRCSPPT
jgi:hypothetical protein